jgi:hypothetical protein
MMLPEHIEALRKLMDKGHYEERPELNEWDLQSIQEEIEVAYKRKCEVLLKTRKDGKIMTCGGSIEGIDLKSMHVVFDNPFGTEHIPVSDIIGVQCLD